MWCLNPKKEFHLERTFLIHIDEQIVMRKMGINAPHLRYSDNKYIDFEFAYFELIKNEKVKSFGLRLSKGNDVIIIFGDYQEWIPLMRPYIIQLSFSQQYEILNRNEYFYQIKCLLNNCEYPAMFIEKKTKNCLEQLFDNIKQVRKLENQNNILGVYELFESRKHFIVVFETFPLTPIIPPLPEEQLQTITFQILSTLHNLHENNMIHGSLNPKNVLIKGDHIKLILICKNIDPNYIESENNGSKSDIYSLGLLLLYYLQGAIPISELSYNELHCLIASQIYKLNHVSLDCQFFLQEILQRNPDNRLSVEQALRHYWFKKKKKQFPIITKSKRVQSMKTIGSLSPIKQTTSSIRRPNHSRLITEPRQYQYKI